MTEQRGRAESEREHHDRVAPDYDRYYVDSLHYRLLHAEFLEDVTACFAPGEGVLADIGAGTGAMAVPLHQRGYDVVAVDNSPGMLAQLSAKAPGIRTLVADACRPLPFADGSVGCVVINETLHHLKGHDAILREVRRILHPLGKLCICEPQLLPRGLDFIRRIARRNLNPLGHTPDEQPIDPGRLKKLLKQNGYTVLRKGTTFFLPFDPKFRPARWFIRTFWRVPGRIPLIRRLGGVFKVCVEKSEPGGPAA